MIHSEIYVTYDVKILLLWKKEKKNICVVALFESDTAVYRTVTRNMSLQITSTNEIQISSVHCKIQTPFIHQTTNYMHCLT